MGARMGVIVTTIDADGDADCGGYCGEHWGGEGRGRDFGNGIVRGKFVDDWRVVSRVAGSRVR